MGNTVTTIDVATLIDVMTHHSNLRWDDSKEWAKTMKEYVAEQQRLHSTVDLVPDRMSDVTIIILSLLCVVLTVVSLYLQKQHRAMESQLHHLESHNINDSTFVKHRLLGMQLENLCQGDSRHSRRELLRESEQQI